MICYNVSDIKNKEKSEKMPVSKAQQRATAKYEAEKYDKLQIRVKKGQKEKIQEYAKRENLSLNLFINQAIESKINSKNEMKYESNITEIELRNEIQEKEIIIKEYQEQHEEREVLKSEERKCELCGKAITGNNKRKKYCSDYCRKKTSKIRTKERKIKESQY
jgi:predicted nucleic acid-binding Zn ribbon protein